MKTPLYLTDDVICSSPLPQHRGTHLLSRERVRLLVVALLAIEIIGFIFLVLGTHGWIVPLPKPTTTDFVSFYAAGHLANAGTPQLAYEAATHLATEEAFSSRGIEYYYFNYPPTFLLLCAALAKLPYLPAFVTFEAATFMLYIAIAGCIIAYESGLELLVLVAFPIVLWNIGVGQNAFLTAALFGGATLLVDRRPIVAGVCFGLLCYKPHLALLVPIALAAGGQWRCFAAAAASTCALVVGSIAVFGWTTWHSFLVTAGASHTMYESGRILFGGFISPFGAVRFWGGDIALAYSIQAVTTIIVAVIVALVWRRRLSLPVRAAVLTAGSVIAVPISLFYDLLLPAVAACWLWRSAGRQGGFSGWEKSLLAVQFLVLFDPREHSSLFQLPVAALAAIAVFALATRQAVIESRRNLLTAGIETGVVSKAAFGSHAALLHYWRHRPRL